MRGGRGRPFDFYGEGVANIDVTGRITREDDEVTLLADFSRRERGILLAGGVLRQLREKENEQPEASERISGAAER